MRTHVEGRVHESKQVHEHLANQWIDKPAYGHHIEDSVTYPSCRKRDGRFNDDGRDASVKAHLPMRECCLQRCP